MPPVQAVAEFLVLVERSGLLPADELKRLRSADPPGDPARSPAERVAGQLVRERLLTKFHATQLLHGRTRGFFLTDKYKILEPIGAGGMGRVLLCEHLILQRLVAIKMLSGSGGKPPPPGAVERFYREARAVAALDHTNVIRVFDVDSAAGVPFMVMEYVDGTDLHKFVSTVGPLPVNQAADYARQAALGLAHAHVAGLVHRDVKPSNILVDRAGVIKLLDMGLARFQQDVRRNASVTERYDPQVVLGTVDFISPEQCIESSTVDIRSDIYSLGATLYFLLTRKLLFEDGTFTQKMLWHQMRVPKPVRESWPDIPEELDAAVVKMLAKQPDDRFQTPTEVAEVLATFATPTPPPPPPVVLPKLNPATYRLGLSPAPPPSHHTHHEAPVETTDTLLTPPPQQAAVPTPTSAGAETRPTKVALPNTTAPSDTARQPTGIPTRRKPRVRRMAAVVGAILLAVLGGVIYLATRSGAPPAAGPGQPPDVSVKAATGAVPAMTGTATEPAVQTRVAVGGSTFIGPLMQHWTGLYRRKAGVEIVYDGVGSGRGIDGLLAGKYVIGTTDAPLSDEQLAPIRAAGREVRHIPLVMGAVVPTYNVPGVPGRLRFTGGLLADVYLGKVKWWRDPAIAVNNPGVTLPDLPITVIYRSDGSGTTFIWTDYLSKVSGVWGKQVGRGTKVEWPVGRGADKSAGLTDEVTRTVGAIGYVELSHAIANSLPVGEVRNRAGRFVAPSLEGVTAAAAASIKGIPDDLRYSLTDAPGDESYPVAGTTWAVSVFPVGGHPDPEAVSFLEWVTHEGQEHVKPLHYAPLPPNLVVRVESTLYQLRKR
jgi:phosphate ABC transporter phosphate-binding protein